MTWQNTPQILSKQNKTKQGINHIKRMILTSKNAKKTRKKKNHTFQDVNRVCPWVD